MQSKKKNAVLSASLSNHMKLQDAYVGESNQIGSWTLIGYTGPGTKIATQTDSTETTNFLYGGGAYKGSDGKATIGGDAVAAAVGKVFPFGNILEISV